MNSFFTNFTRAFLVFVLLMSASASAQWSGDPSVNTHALESPSAVSNIKSVPDNSNGIISVALIGSSTNLVAQRLDGDGVKQWGANGINLLSTGYFISDYSITSDGAGGVVIAWADARNTNYDIFTQRIDSVGNVLWTADGVNITNIGNTQFQTSVAEVDGDFVVSWTDQRLGGANPREVAIFAQKLNSAGVPQWTANGVLVIDLAQAQQKSKVVASTGGTVFIAYEDESNSYPHRAAVIKVDGSGAVVGGSNTLANAATGFAQYLLDATSDGSGGVILFMQDLRTGTPEYFSQRISTSYTRLYDAASQQLSFGGGASNGVIASDNTGGSYVAFKQSSAIVTLYTPPTGGMVPGSPQVFSVSASAFPVTSVTSDGNLIVSWQDGTSPTINIKAEKVNQSGTQLWPSAVDVSNATADQGTWLSSVSDNNGGAVFAFSDTRNFGTARDIYAQQVASDGSLGTGTTPPMGPDVPVLSAPANTATAQSLTPSLVWNSAATATSYRVQLASDAGFSTVLVDTVTTDTSYSVYTGLSNYTEYYWKVKAFNSFDSSAFSSAFSFRTLLAVPTLSTPANNSIFAALSPTLTWNAVTGAASYDVQVATDAIFTNIIETATGETGTSYALTTTLNHYTVYYWRVRATDGSETTNYSSVFNFRTLITTPVLSAPVDGALVQPVNAVFDWDDVTGATSYRLQVATDTGFTSIVRNITGISSSGHTLSAALDYYTVYYWRVSAFDGAHETVYSTKWSFETEIDAPDLVSPGYLTPGNSIHPTLVWRTVDGADNYRAQFSALSDFSTLMYDSVMTDTTLYIDSILANNTLYYWRVYAENANPDVSPWSSSIFRTVTEVIPYLTHPINNHLVYTLDPTVHWNINVSGVGISYDVQYSVDSTFPSALTTTLDAGSAITDTLFGLLPATQYFWRVRSKNATAIITYSAHNSFTTFGEVNTIPTQSWPVGGATVYSLAPNLYWYLGVTSFGYIYEIQYKEVSSGTWSAPMSAGTSLTLALSGLTPGTEYEWQVRSLNGIDTSDWSASALFTTYSSSAVTAVQPYISYPTSGVMVYTLMPTLYWWIGQSHAGLTFNVEIYTDTTGSPVHSASGITDINYQTPTLLPGTMYYFRVQSDNGSTQSAWTYFESFETFGVTGEIQPILSFPIGGQIIYSDATTLYWYMVGSADTVTYELQFKANDSSFSSTITLDTTSYAVSSLQAGTTYFWRVRSYNGNAYSNWTAAEHFEVTGNAGTLVPILTWPLGGAATGTDVDLYWYVNGSSPSISYEVHYASESDFSNAVTVSTGSSTTTQLTGLVPGVIYYWKVRSFNGTSWSAFSNTETFATQAGASPVRPKGGSPVNSVSLTTNNAELSWFLPSLASGLSYEVQYSQNSDFSNAVTVGNITTTSYMANALPTGAPLYWRVRSKNAAGLYSAYSKPERFIPNTPTSTEELTVIPTEFALGQNYPNPFNPTTVIRFDLPQEIYVTVKIYDMLGREVKTLIADTKSAGSYSMQWAGDDNRGAVVAAGTYLYRITAGNFVQTKKMVYLK